MSGRFAILLVTVLGLVGCGREGKLGLAAEEGSNKIGASRLQYALPPPLRINGMSITRIDISTTGEVWKTLFAGEATLEVNGANVKIGVQPISVEPDEYHGVRVWFGSSGTLPLVSGGELPNAQDLKGQSPWTYSTLNGKLSFPAVVERGKDLYLVLAFTFKSVATERDFLPGYIPSSARTTRFIE